MPTYLVELPVTGVARVEVEADSEESAIELALSSCDRDNIEEWDVLHSITEGNVCYAMHPWHAAAEIVK